MLTSPRLRHVAVNAQQHAESGIGQNPPRSYEAVGLRERARDPPLLAPSRSSGYGRPRGADDGDRAPLRNLPHDCAQAGARDQRGGISTILAGAERIGTRPTYNML